jgi:hypothetical protein
VLIAPGERAVLGNGAIRLIIATSLWRISEHLMRHVDALHALFVGLTTTTRMIFLRKRFVSRFNDRRRGRLRDAKFLVVIDPGLLPRIHALGPSCSTE